jgi:hypothetical protein
MSRKPIFSATSSLDALLTSGGDDRLLVDESMGSNKYGCSPHPASVAAYSYTTASSISMGAYMHVTAIYNEIQDLKIDAFHDWATRRFQKIKSRLIKLYGLDRNDKFIFGASGTDLELVALWASAASGKKVNNIVVGAVETGSDIKYVSKGQYYEDRTVLGNRVETGAVVPGFDQLIGNCTHHVPIRESDGSERSSGAVTRDIRSSVERSLNENQRPLIHLVHRSKTGLIQPNFEDLQSALQPHQGQYDVVVDACQGRISAGKFKQYLASGCMVLFTGSKFFGGPPFSGVLIVPDALSDHSPSDAPEGLSHFFTETEFCDIQHSERSCSPKINLGLILRWEAAMYEIVRYFSLNQAQCGKVVDEFCKAINSFARVSKLFKVLDSRDLGIKPSEIEPEPLDMDSIYTFEIIPPPEYGIEPDYALAIEVYHSLNQDISRLVPRADSGIGQFRLRLGQPVKSHPDDDDWKPTLRVSLGAPLISDLYFLDESEIFERFMSDFEMLERKTDLILRMTAGHW